jgi:hypothetical protein
VRVFDGRTKLPVRAISERPPGRHLRRPETLGLPHVPDTGDETLVEHGVPDWARLVDRTQVADDRVDVERTGEDVRA